MQNTYPTQTAAVMQPQVENNIMKKGSILTDFLSLSLFKKFWMILVSFVVLLFIVTSLPRLILRPSNIQVIGEGKLNFEADKVKMVVTKVNTGTSSTATINEGEIGINLLVDSAKNVAGEDIIIKKAFYQVQPVATSTGVQYQVANAFSIEFSNVAKTNEMIKSLYIEGATSVSNVTFESTNKEEISQEARSLAVKNAKEEAKSIAKAAGKRVGKLISISDDNQEVSSTVTNINNQVDNANFSNVSIIKTVSVIYEIW